MSCIFLFWKPRSGFLESGVERIVDQVVNPKISSVFLPKVEEVVYRFLGIQKPESASTSQDDKVKTEDLLPTDLEAVSPESVHGIKPLHNRLITENYNLFII